MNELINVKMNEEQQQVVSARDLYAALEIKQRFSAWFENNSKNLIEDVDFTTVLTDTEVKNNGGTQLRQLQDYQLTLDASKQIAMMSASDKGKQIRMYFIEVEKAWNSPEQVMARGLQVAQQQMLQYDKQIKELSTTIQKQKPKVEYFDKVINSDNTMTVTQIAQDYGMSAKEMNKLLHNIGIQYKVNGQWVLYAGLANKGYTESTTGTNDYGTYTTTKWTQRGRQFIYETLKEQGILTSNEHVDDINEKIVGMF